MSGADKVAALDALALKVILPYVIIAVVLVIMAVLIWISSLPEVEAKEEKVSDEGAKRTSLFGFPYFWLGVVALFFYVAAVDTLINYGLSLGFDINVAKFFSSFTLIAMIVGYFVIFWFATKGHKMGKYHA